MNNEVQKFDKLKKKMLVYPTSIDEQTYITNSMKSNLKTLLRKEAKYGIILWFILSIGFFFKKFNLTLTFFQSQIIAIASATVVTASTATGIFYSVQYIKKIINEPKKIHEEEKNKSEIKNHSINNKLPIQKKRMDKAKIQYQSTVMRNSVKSINENKRQKPPPVKKNNLKKNKLIEDEGINSIIDTPDM